MVLQSKIIIVMAFMIILSSFVYAVVCEEGYAQCSDGTDNDGDSLIDYPYDSECRSPLDNNETINPMCSNGVDDNSDGNMDYPYDSTCDSAEDDLEGKIVMAVGEYEENFWARFIDWLIFWD